MLENLLYFAVLVEMASSAITPAGSKAFVMQKECAKFGNQSYQQNPAGRPKHLVVDVGTWLPISLTDRHGYEANVDCTIVFKAEPSRILLFKLEDLEMERSRDCVNDFLLISNTMRGDVVLCGSGKRVDSFYSFNSTISLRFVSNRDLMNTMRGFTGYFTSLYTEPCSNRVGLFGCKNGFCVEDNLECNGVDNCGDNSDETLCKEKQWYIIALITSLGLIAFFITIAGITFFARRADRRQLFGKRKKGDQDFDDNDGDNGDQLSMTSGRRYPRTKVKKRVNFCSTIKNCTEDDDEHSKQAQGIVIDDPSNYTELSTNQDWKNLIFDTKNKQGQMHLYALPDSTNFTDLCYNAENAPLTCPEFASIQELMRTSGGFKGFSVAQRRSFRGANQNALHQLCALCLMTDLEQQQQAKQPNRRESLGGLSADFPGYRCPNACKKDANAAFYLQNSIDRKDGSGMTPSFAVLSQHPSYYMLSSSEKNLSTLSSNANRAQQLPFTVTKLQHSHSQNMDSLSSRSSTGGGTYPVVRRGCRDKTPESLKRPLVFVSSKKNEVPMLYDQNAAILVQLDRKEAKMKPPPPPPPPPGYNDDGSAVDMSTSQPLKSALQKTTSLSNCTVAGIPLMAQDIVCKHQGKRVRILSSKVTAPTSPGGKFNGSEQSGDEGSDDDDGDSDDSVIMQNDHKLRWNNRQARASTTKQHHRHQQPSNSVSSSNDDGAVAYAVIDRRRSFQHRHRDMPRVDHSSDDDDEDDDAVDIEAAKLRKSKKQQSD